MRHRPPAEQWQCENLWPLHLQTQICNIFNASGTMEPLFPNHQLLFCSFHSSQNQTKEGWGWGGGGWGAGGVVVVYSQYCAYWSWCAQIWWGHPGRWQGVGATSHRQCSHTRMSGISELKQKVCPSQSQEEKQGRLSLHSWTIKSRTVTTHNCLWKSILNKICTLDAAIVVNRDSCLD